MKSSRQRNRRRGSAILETALLLPVAVLLCLGGWDFSRLYMAGAQLESSAAVAAAYAARETHDLAPAEALGWEDLPDSPQSSVSVEIVCACSAAPQAWGACEEIACDAGERCRYARAVAEMGFVTVGRYPGVPVQSTLRREHFVRAE